MVDQFQCGFSKDCKNLAYFREAIKVSNEEEAVVKLIFCRKHVKRITRENFQAKKIGDDENFSFEVVSTE